jgi:hypothetical protein
MVRSVLRAVILTLAFSPAAHAVALGQLDSFSAGVEGWFAGGGPFGQVPPIPPQVVAGGGPGGAKDSFLQITANGSEGPGGRLVGMNASQWAGNYTAAGVTGIRMSLRNLSNTDLRIRLYLEDPIPGPPQNEAVTTHGVSLAAGSGWTSVLFPITSDDLTVLQGDAATLLSNTTVLRIFHNPDADFPGVRIAGVLGVDNVSAVPEPSAIALMLAGLGILGGIAGRGRRTTR